MSGFRTRGHNIWWSFLSTRHSGRAQERAVNGQLIEGRGPCTRGFVCPLNSTDQTHHLEDGEMHVQHRTADLADIDKMSL